MARAHLEGLAADGGVSFPEVAVNQAGGPRDRPGRADDLGVRAGNDASVGQRRGAGHGQIPAGERQGMGDVVVVIA